MKRRVFLFAGLASGLAALGGGLLFSHRDRLAPLLNPLVLKLRGRRTVADVMDSLGDEALARVQPDFSRVGLSLSMLAELRFIGLKQEKKLEMWARADDSAWHRIKTYPILAASGGPGPKLREGDRQVPEGLYEIEYLNPNSAYHLSLKLNYPNQNDRVQATLDGRTNLGGDIMIHGKSASVGCLAIGDPAIEEVFALVARLGRSRVSALIVPTDLRLYQAQDEREWVQTLYDQLSLEIAPFAEG
ncbi:MAG: L,D-transpeptidase family protein [Pseudomonadota bacterium]